MGAGILETAFLVAYGRRLKTMLSPLRIFLCLIAGREGYRANNPTTVMAPIDRGEVYRCWEYYYRNVVSRQIWARVLETVLLPYRHALLQVFGEIY